MARKQEVILDEESFTRNLEHAKASYANAQEAIRFVDSKTAILTGIVVLSTGIPFAVGQFICSDDSIPQSIFTWLSQYHVDHPILFRVKIGGALAASLCGVLSLLASTNGLMSRLPRRGSRKEFNILLPPMIFLLCRIPFIRGFFNPPKPRVTCLFPLHNPASLDQARIVFEKIGRGGYSRNDVLEEYQIQLESVGAILETKIRRNREAVGWFEVQIVFYLGCAVAWAPWHELFGF